MLQCCFDFPSILLRSLDSQVREFLCGLTEFLPHLRFKDFLDKVTLCFGRLVGQLNEFFRLFFEIWKCIMQLLQEFCLPLIDSIQRFARRSNILGLLRHRAVDSIQFFLEGNHPGLYGGIRESTLPLRILAFLGLDLHSIGFIQRFLNIRTYRPKYRLKLLGSDASLRFVFIHPQRQGNSGIVDKRNVSSNRRNDRNSSQRQE